MSLGHWTYTVVGVFNSRGEAKRSKREIARSLNDGSMWNDVSWNADDDVLVDVLRDYIYISVNTPGWEGVDRIKDILQRHGAIQVNQYADAQVLEVIFTFATALDTSSSTLGQIRTLLQLKRPNLSPLLDSSASLKSSRGKTNAYTFHYVGDYAYDDEKKTLFGYAVGELGCEVVEW